MSQPTWEGIKQLSAEVWGVIGAVGGGIATEGFRLIANHFKAKRESADKGKDNSTKIQLAELSDEAKQRKEMRDDIVFLRGELRRQDELIIRLQTDYFKLAQEANAVRIELNSTKNELMDTKRELLKAQGELSQARQQIAVLQAG
jgi:hypothetical protein